ncbi:MAG: hypothetical protein HEQ23_14250 [Tepidisphaera sp.]
MTSQASKPMCDCGYELSGLAGPPWACPECAKRREVWPPPEWEESARTSPREWAVARWSLLAMVPPVLVVPWIGSTLMIVPLAIAAVGCVVFAAALSWSFVRGKNGAELLIGLMPFGCMMAFMFVFGATMLFAIVQILRGAFA